MVGEAAAEGRVLGRIAQSRAERNRIERSKRRRRGGREHRIAMQRARHGRSGLSACSSIGGEHSTADRRTLCHARFHPPLLFGRRGGPRGTVGRGAASGDTQRDRTAQQRVHKRKRHSPHSAAPVLAQSGLGSLRRLVPSVARQPARLGHSKKYAERKTCVTRWYKRDEDARTPAHAAATIACSTRRLRSICALASLSAGRRRGATLATSRIRFEHAAGCREMVLDS